MRPHRALLFFELFSLFSHFSEGVRSLRCDCCPDLMTVKKFKENWTACERRKARYADISTKKGFCLILTRCLVDLDFTKKIWGSKFELPGTSNPEFFRHNGDDGAAAAGNRRPPPPPPPPSSCATNHLRMHNKQLDLSPNIAFAKKTKLSNSAITNHHQPLHPHMHLPRR